MNVSATSYRKYDQIYDDLANICGTYLNVALNFRNLSKCVCCGKQQPQELNSLLKRQTCQQLKVSCGAAACRKQDIVNNVLDEKGVCKVERYVEMRSTRIVVYSRKINKYM